MFRFRKIFAGLVAGLMAALVIGSGTSFAATGINNYADIGVGVHLASSENGVLSYTVTVENRGSDPARNLKVTVPFDSSVLSFVGAESSSSDVIVDASSSELVIRTDRLSSGNSSFAVTLSFAQLTDGAQLVDRLSYTWTSGGTHYSNDPTAGDAPVVALTPNGDTFTFTSSAFGSDEPVVFWFNAPDGSVIAANVKRGVVTDRAWLELKSEGRDSENYDKGAEYAVSDASGLLSVEVSTSGLTPGAYTVVASGAATGQVVVGTFQVQ